MEKLVAQKSTEIVVIVIIVIINMHSPSAFSDFIIVNVGVISTAAVMVSHSARALTARV